MPKYKYHGEGPCNYGTQIVNTGDIIEASARPGKRFELIDEPKSPEPEPQSVAQSVEEPLTEEAPGKSRRKGGE